MGLRVCFVYCWHLFSSTFFKKPLIQRFREKTRQTLQTNINQTISNMSNNATYQSLIFISLHVAEFHRAPVQDPLLFLSANLSGVSVGAVQQKEDRVWFDAEGKILQQSGINLWMKRSGSGFKMDSWQHQTVKGWHLNKNPVFFRWDVIRFILHSLA